MSTILFVGGGRDTFETLAKAKSAGVDVLYLQKPGAVTEPQRELADEVIEADLDSPEELLSAAKALYLRRPFKTAISLFENSLVAAARIREDLRLPGNSLATVRILKDKGLMRDHLAQTGLSPVRYRRGRDLNDILTFLMLLGEPVLVKPIDAAGSLGVRLVQNPKDADALIRDYRARGIEQFLIEEYLEGIEVSVEAFSFSGHHVVLAVTDKQTFEGFIEKQHSMPSALDCKHIQSIQDLAVQFLDAVGLQEGPSHTEVKLTKNGPRIIESHDRIGGDRIHQLIHSAYGLDVKQMTFEWYTGKRTPLGASPAAIGAAAIRYFSAEPGIVESVLGEDLLSNSPLVLEHQISVAPGSLVCALRSSYDRCGYFIVSAKSMADVAAACEQLGNEVKIVSRNPEPNGTGLLGNRNTLEIAR